jgi:basic membrane lipoprotein Med (substrate-binding protein (PBP1-ABC) superfamily)
MRFRLLPAGTLAVAVAAVVLVSGCGSGDGRPTALGTLGPGFFDPSASPAPEATIKPRPGSWDDVRPSKGYRVVLLTTGKDPQTRTLVNAVTEWAKKEHVSLKTVTATEPNQFIPRISAAIKQAPDLVISAGNDLVDPLTMVTPSHLDQQFLVVGAELAEPTANVTAADWTGASFRGEGLGMSSTYDPATFTSERAARAVRAGTAAVLNGLTGIVIWLD